MREQATEAPPVEGESRGPGWGWGELLMALVVMLGGSAAILLLARFIIQLTGATVEERLSAPAFYLVGVGVYLSAILGVYLFGARRAGWRALGLRGAPWREFVLVPPLFILGLFSLALVNLGVGQVSGGFENPQVDALTGGRPLAPFELAALLALVAGLVPFAEELLFRGMLYPLLRGRTPAALAIVLNAALFAMAHVVPLLLPGLFVVGLFLAYLRERSGSIWPAVLFHAMQNATALLLINAALSVAPA